MDEIKHKIYKSHPRALANLLDWGTSGPFGWLNHEFEQYLDCFPLETGSDAEDSIEPEWVRRLGTVAGLPQDRHNRCEDLLRDANVSIEILVFYMDCARSCLEQSDHLMPPLVAKHLLRHCVAEALARIHQNIGALENLELKWCLERQITRPQLDEEALASLNTALEHLRCNESAQDWD